MSAEQLWDCFHKNDVDGFKYFAGKDTFISGYFIDVAVEEGNVDMANMLINNFGQSPSKYAVQMLNISGKNREMYQNISKLRYRNDRSICAVHRKFDRSVGKFVWGDYIPDEFRVVE